ncbi:tyrosine-type recombinase/integrase [Synechococcus sp. KORDI-52]|uniref:tyrosine-type recombinase/integrase n=1 Tax=Synechococcus sp. KORDI-52 TaxID=585425 RepID=UPI0008FFC647|nr:tyrosine-type recombinase/integrase [Synechococcus sp. KORDI-52]
MGTDELDLLISKLPEQHHQITAEVCRRTGCRIGEATLLTWDMVSESAVTFQRGITKGKLASRSVPVTPQLWEALCSWRSTCVVRQGREPVAGDYLVPGRFAGSCLSTCSFMDALERAAAESGLEGVLSHSFRRSALTSAHNAGVPLRVVMALSGHKSMSALQRYLEVTPAQREAAAAAFA